MVGDCSDIPDFWLPREVETEEGEVDEEVFEGNFDVELLEELDLAAVDDVDEL
ncbi:hypothetical protein TREMEDRAFT_57358 [Tremella mesenterica DSM 1558]|uniref:uncharacterized protein n=1 Tax=Tremella mesenterica (strain ATCC 24925 / CBS 8224 / DSM 1558 / NBRC 9311 / NRRL Y-6157 / RJB 2259-6 / UBC 559-6) TaxID=578456 RepID=UPI0003F48D02|nr:uncharacterized protein TREMEDRAFT_57358 [Tremella mesenterica DSM 1558]EIW67831.1 hypothetical protein TREMEDRAFT_57358 [Tremella mesenterica DSM 1558]